jgi:hypothetical protein
MKSKLIIFSTVILILSSVQAKANDTAEDLSKTYVTDKSDRTLLKQIIVSQQQILSALNEIKTSIDKISQNSQK